MRTLALLVTLSACGAPAPSQPPPTPMLAARYAVHEWGLVRGDAADHVMLSGPHTEPPPVPIAKPVLYFHREGEGALVVDVEARIPNGRVVERWPTSGGAPGSSVEWRGVTIRSGSCRGSRYPSLGDDPCTFVSDGCEAATLASAETLDSDCLFWPRAPGDEGATQAWNHLFYRGEVRGTPASPLRVEPLPDGSLRVTAIGTERIPGRLVRVRRANGAPGVTDAAEVAAPPPPGSSAVIAAPRGPLSAGADALAGSVAEVGLTDAEVGAFRRAWDDTVFGTAPQAASATPTSIPMARPMGVPTPTTSLLYVLPTASADALATLSFSPPPTAVRRAIVIWLDEARAP